MDAFETNRLLLRAPTLDDAERVFEIYGDPVTNRFNPAGPHASQSISDAILDGWLEHWQTHGFGIWAITTKQDSHDVIGFGGLGWNQEKELGWVVNLGYRFTPRAWGNGYATELGHSTIRFARKYVATDELHGFVRPNHQQSIHVLEKLGFVRHGTLNDVADAAPSLVMTLVLRQTGP